MDFERRAQKARSRGEPVRAVVALAEGLKRRPERESALEDLVECYTREVETPGLERDVVAALIRQEDAARLVDLVYRRLVDLDCRSRAAAFERVAEEEGFETSNRRQSGDEVASSGPESAELEMGSGAGGGARRVEETSGTVVGAAPSGEPTETPPDGSSGTDREEEGDTARSGGDHGGRQKPSESRGTGPRDGEASRRGRLPARRGWSWRRIGISVFVMGAVAIAVWQAGFVQGSEAVGAGPLRSLDPSEPGAIEGAVSWGTRARLSEAAADERGQFVRAIRALEAGRSISFEEAPTTPWGRSARAMAALTRDNLEAAVRAETKLERSPASDGLASLWTSGRVAEFRGRLESASRSYNLAADRFPEFVPAITGSMRTALYRLDGERLSERVDQLRSRNDRHPYLGLEAVQLPGEPPRGRPGVDERKGSSRGVDPSEQQTADSYRSEFLEDVELYSEARGALRERAYGRAAERADRVLERRTNFGPALWIRALARAAQFDVESADRDFGRIVELPHLARSYRWRLVAVVPEVLTGAGRPDLGAKYMLPGIGAVSTVPPLHAEEESASEGGLAEGSGSRDHGDNSGEGEVRTERISREEWPETVVSRAAKWKFEPAGELVSQEVVSQEIVEAAYLARIRVLLELGHLGRVRQLFGGLPALEYRTHQRKLLYAEFDARRGWRPAGPTDQMWEEATPVERLVDAYYSGEYDDAIEIGTALLEEGVAGVRTARFVALSYAATDRGRSARRALETLETDPWMAPRIERIRARIWARVAPGHPRSAGAAESFREIVPTSTGAAVDLAAVQIWNRRVEKADLWSRHAVARCPDFSEANWFRGIALRLRGDSEGAESHFRRAWRAERGEPRLALELGYVHLAREEYELASGRFYRALLEDPASLEAIRGLGRAYQKYDSDEGRWNFERILENYEDDSARAVQAAEVLRWLAVFHGSRAGTEEGAELLDRAVQRAGARAVLLLEKARSARGRGNTERARELYVEALERDSTSARAHLGLARIAASRDNERTVRSHIERYLALEPHGEGAEWARDELERLDENRGERRTERAEP